MAVLPISVTCPLKILLGMASIVMSAVWPSCTLTMSVSSTFTSAVIRDISAMVMMVLPSEFWMPGTTDSPTRTGRLVTTPSSGAVESYLRRTSATRASPARAWAMCRWVEASCAAFCSRCRPGLHDAGLRLRDLRLLGFVGEFLELEILAREQFFVEQLLGAIVIGLHAIQVGFVVLQPGLHGADVFVGHFEAGFRSRRVGLRRADVGLLGRHVGRGLGVFHARQQLALADVVAFLDQDFRDVAHRVGADIDVVLGLDLARGSDDRRQVATRHLSGLHRHYAALAIHRARVNSDDGHQQGRQCDDYLPLSFHDNVLSPL